ncbi:MAG: hypothetical protein IJ498_03705 [Akkermansia sp.]|nr:hypothetical protein [Akkermansia sp.]
MPTTLPESRQHTENELFPGERILWLRETPPAIRERICEMATEFWVEVFVTGLLMTGVILLPMMLAPMLHEAFLPVLLILFLYRTVHFVLRCYRRHFRQWEVITNRRLLFFKREWNILYLEIAPLNRIRLIPGNRRKDGSADLSICGPRSFRSHLPVKALQRVEAADELLSALRADIPAPLPVPQAQLRPHPLLPEDEALLGEGIQEAKAYIPLKPRILTGIFIIYLLTIGGIGLLFPPIDNHPEVWIYWGILLVLMLTVAFFQWKNRHRYTTPKRFALGSRFLYVEGYHPRPITGCYPAGKRIYPDGRIELVFNTPCKAFRDNIPFGLDNLLKSRETEQILHAICAHHSRESGGAR